MTFLKIALAVYVLFLFPLSSLSAEPQGELYWMVDSNSEAEQAAMEINPPGLTTGSISGRVTNEDGNGIGEIYVTLHRSNPLAAFIQRVKTGSDGSYVLTELAEGSYKIRFHGQLYQTVYLEEWYNDKSSFNTAEVVAVTASSPVVTNIDAELALAGSIRGRVTDEAGNGIAGVSIYAYNSSSWISRYKGPVNTALDGTYTMPGLSSGSYKLSFSSNNYANEWYSDSRTFAQADAVTVAAPQTTSGINTVLFQGGNITGKVTDQQGNGIEGIGVFAYDIEGDWEVGRQTEGDGSYTLPHLLSGMYRIEFDAGRVNSDKGTNYISTFYSDKKGFLISDPVAVIDQETISNINAVLGAGGSISGRVTDSSGQGISSVDVSIYDSLSYSRYGAVIESSSTDADGKYTVRGVPVGSYKVQLNTYIKNFGNDFNYANAWYNGGRSFADADIVQVTAPDITTSGINVVLAEGGSVSGTVTDKSGHGLADIFVYAYADSSSPLGYGYTDLDGKYTIFGLPEGAYAVFFDSFVRNLLDGDRCIDEWYSDKNDYFHADSVIVTAPNTTTSGIDAVLQRMGSSLVPILQLLLL